MGRFIQSPLGTALAYAAIAGGWVASSSILVDQLPSGPTFELLKGIAFVAATAVVLLVLLRRQVHALETQRAADQQIRDQAQLISQIEDGVVLTDERQRVRYWNPITEAILGISATQAMGRDFLELVPSLKPDGASDEAGTWRGDARLTRPDGREIWVSVTSSMAPVEGRPGRLSILRDVTEARRQTLLLNTVLDEAPVALIMVDRDGMIRVWNRKAASLLGWTSRGGDRPAPTLDRTRCPG